MASFSGASWSKWRERSKWRQRGEWRERGERRQRSRCGRRHRRICIQWSGI